MLAFVGIANPIDATPALCSNHTVNMRPKSNGFTLVELAIVLVIVGLIVGGVLVGQDLIKAAQIRATISDIEKYNAAATTFREKYTGLPGDLLNTKAVQFGFNTTATDHARDGTAGRGDGNGLIGECAFDTWVGLGCESVLFWTDLSKAGLVNMRSTLTSITGVEQDSLALSQLSDGILPKTKLRDTALISVFSTAGKNGFGIGEFVTNAPSGRIIIGDGAARGLTPLEAHAIDLKLDDGAPMTGGIISLHRYLNRPDWLASGANCMNAAGTQYNTATDILATADTCSISIRAAF